MKRARSREVAASGVDALLGGSGRARLSVVGVEVLLSEAAEEAEPARFGINDLVSTGPVILVEFDLWQS